MERREFLRLSVTLSAALAVAPKIVLAEKTVPLIKIKDVLDAKPYCVRIKNDSYIGYSRFLLSPHQEYSDWIVPGYVIKPGQSIAIQNWMYGNPVLLYIWIFEDGLRIINEDRQERGHGVMAQLTNPPLESDEKFSAWLWKENEWFEKRVEDKVW